MATIYVSQTASASGGITFGVGDDSRTRAVAGDPSTPLLTLDGAGGAIAKAVDGDSIIVNDGTYTATTFFNFANKTLTVDPARAYGVTLKRTGAQTRVVNFDISGKTVSFGPFIINAESNASTGGITIASVAVLPNLTLRGTQIINVVAGASCILSNSALLTLRMFGVIAAALNAAAVRTGTALVGTSSVIISGCTLSAVNANTALGTVHLTASATGAWAIVRNNRISFYNTGNNAVGPIVSANVRSLVEYNILDADGTASGTALVHISSLAAVLAENSVVRWNIGRNRGSAGYLMRVGEEVSGANNNMVNYPVVYGNVFAGNYAGTGMHGFMLGWIKGGCVTGNAAFYVGIPFLSKDQSERAYFVNNVAAKGSASTSGMLRAKGSTNTVFAGNTIHTDAISANTAMLADTDPAVNVSTGIDYIANTIKAAWTATAIASVAATCDAEFLFNDYDYDALSGNPWSYTGVNYASLAAWLAVEPTAQNVPVGVNDKEFWPKFNLRGGLPGFGGNGILPTWGR